MSENQVLPKTKKPTHDPRRISEVNRMVPAAVVSELVRLVGARITAAVGNVTDTRHVRAWESGSQEPQRTEALRAALQAARLLTDVEGPDAARGWFTGCNVHFRFESPLEKLAENTAELRTAVVAAAYEEVGG